MISAATGSTELHTFKLAHPVVRPTTRFDLTAIAVLSMAAITTWFLVLPVEFVLHLSA